MRNKIFLIILSFILLFYPLFLIKSYANEQYFQVSSEVGRQSVWTNAIPINVYITPQTDYDKVEISFNYGSITEVVYKGPQFFPVKAGETYKVQAKVYPKEPGVHHITINSIAWEYNTNYTSSASTRIEIDENLQIVPQTQAFKIFNVLKIIFITLLIVAAIAGLVFLTIKNLDKIKKWLEPEY